MRPMRSMRTARRTPAGQEVAAELPAPPTEGLDEARALVDAGRFAEALDILGPLVSGRVVEANAVFLYGLAAVGASQHPKVSDENREALLRRRSAPSTPCCSSSPTSCGCGSSSRAPSTSRATTSSPGATSSWCWAPARRSRWSPTSAASCSRSTGAGAGATGWAPRSRRTATSAAPRRSAPSTSSTCPSSGTSRSSPPPASASRSGAARSTSTC